MKAHTLYSELLDIYRMNNLHSQKTEDKLLNMLNNKGAVLTVKDLIRSDDETFGVEEMVLKEEFSELFSREDKEICKRKLGLIKDGVNISFE